jgi:hypothetical protein
LVGEVWGQGNLGHSYPEISEALILIAEENDSFYVIF